jgi:hypothetical protein
MDEAESALIDLMNLPCRRAKKSVGDMYTDKDEILMEQLAWTQGINLRNKAKLQPPLRVSPPSPPAPP